MEARKAPTRRQLEYRKAWTRPSMAFSVLVGGIHPSGIVDTTRRLPWRQPLPPGIPARSTRKRSWLSPFAGFDLRTLRGLERGNHVLQPLDYARWAHLAVGLF